MPTAGFVRVMLSFGKRLYCLVKMLHIANWSDVPFVDFKRRRLPIGETGRTGSGMKSSDIE